MSGLPNICLVGEQPYSSLPEWLAQWDVCVIPFKITPLTAATDPVKVYEMLAAGRPIVATPMDELADLANRGLVRLAATAKDMIAQLQASCAEDDDTRRAERRRFAAETAGPIAERTWYAQAACRFHGRRSWWSHTTTSS